MADLEEQAKKLDFRGVMITSIITALSFVVALFWRDAISATISQLFPETHELLFKYTTAFVFTLIVVVVSFALLKSQEIKIHHIISLKKKLKEKENTNKDKEIRKELNRLITKLAKYKKFRYQYKPKKQFIL